MRSAEPRSGFGCTELLGATLGNTEKETGMTTKLTKLWHNEMPLPSGDIIELRADFSNDRHHAVLVEPPHGPIELARALDRLARQIATDPHLQPAST